jgi:hypothetical protein
MDCQPYEVKKELAKKMTSEYCYQYQSTDLHRKAVELGVDSKLMRYVQAVAWIQAQAIVSKEYTSYSYGGEVVKGDYSYEKDIAPHLRSNDDYRALARDIWKEALSLTSVEVNPTSVVLNAIGMGEYVGIDNLSARGDLRHVDLLKHVGDEFL